MLKLAKTVLAYQTLDILKQQSQPSNKNTRCPAGLTAGTLSSIVNIPFDVAKSRIQGPQPIPGQIKYRTCFATMATVSKEEGVGALYRGLVPKIMRLGPGGAIMLLVYDYSFEYLKKEYL